MSLLDRLRRLWNRLKVWLGLIPPKPGNLFLKELQEDGEMLKATINLPAPTAKDQGSREFHAMVEGTERPVQTLSGDALEAVVGGIPEDSQCEVWLFDLDKKGNRSVESDRFTFVAEDNFAPGKPGQLGIKNIEEEV